MFQFKILMKKLTLPTLLYKIIIKTDKMHIYVYVNENYAMRIIAVV